MKILAPAKVNLFLRVVGVREAGYHLVDSLMVPVDLYDEVEITRPKWRSESLTVTCDHPRVPEGRRNIAYRAASLLLRERGFRGPVRIHIRKRIPVGAGLGGGSSDAAATLLGLNRLFRLGCGRGYLLSLAARLGADVPFFIFSRPARARGIGEELTPVTALPKLWIVMLYPGFSISTRWAYQKFPMTLTKPIETTSIKRSLKDPKTLARLLTNDLERVAIRRYPRIAFLKERLIQEGAVGALMSGSGSSVFGIFATGRRARKGFDRLRKEKGVSAYLVHSLG